jgi:thioesterase domain-containing protein
MLVPLHKSGSKAPLFFVHGLRGITFAVGSRFAQVLGPDQPFYVINANGMDGREPILNDVQAMIDAYLQEIRLTRPAGPLRIGGMCAGGLIAIEIVRALQSEGRVTGPVMLVDPPVMPIGREKRVGAIDASRQVMDRAYQDVRGRYLERTSDPEGYDDLPFDPRDPKQLDLATNIAVGTMLAFAKYVPRPFTGSTEAVISEDRALAFLHPQMPWRKLLCGPRVVHVLPWSHREMFRTGRRTVARLMKSMLETDETSENLPNQVMQPASQLIPEVHP